MFLFQIIAVVAAQIADRANRFRENLKCAGSFQPSFVTANFRSLFFKGSKDLQFALLLARLFGHDEQMGRERITGLIKIP